MQSMQPSRESQQVADIANSTLGAAILGSATCLMMGLAGGLAVRNPLRGAMVGIICQAFGALAGAAAAYGLNPLRFRQVVPDSNDLLTPILIDGGIWAAIGVVGAVAFVAATNTWRKLPIAILSACVGALVASIVYHVLTALLYPNSASSGPIGHSTTVRLLATSLAAFFVAIGVAKGTLGRRRLPGRSALAS
jgi:hypothetical protein